MVATALIRLGRRHGQLLLTIRPPNRRAILHHHRAGFVSPMAPLNILHVFRAPVGGLFRHVLDLARGQISRGHRVGIIADSITGGETADAVLSELAPSLALGLSRHPMRRQANPGDVLALAHVMGRVAKANADVVHGHGAKGGAYARLAFNAPRAVRAYTPHGGSLLFSHDSLAGNIYLATERFLMLRGDLFLFESAYSEQAFRRKIGDPRGLVRVVHNGVSRAEFEPVAAQPNATDLVFVGELRAVKGIDVLIDAIAILKGGGRRVTATLVGSGPDRDALRAQVERLGLTADVSFEGAMPARKAFALGRVMVVPSRAESLPYIVLEAAAAGKPLIATRVGGIPEIYGPLSDALLPPQDAEVLARAVAATLDDPGAAAETARRLRERVAENFSVENMVDGVLAGYRDALETLQKVGRR
jgi:glycosyltransferase involved in cell wall biosynthesis